MKNVIRKQLTNFFFGKNYNFAILKIVELCMIPEDIIPDQECNWVTSLHESRWARGISAGGCTNFMKTFWRNPQFLMTLVDVDDDSETDC